jgi:hypothetical protein
LAYLLLYRNAPWTRQRLAFVLWPDSAVTASSDATAPLLHSSDALAIPLRGGRRPRARASSGIRRLAEPEASDRRGRVVEMDEQREHYAPRAPPLTMQMHAGSRPTSRPNAARRLQSSLRRLRAAFRALLLRPDGPLGGGGKKPAMRAASRAVVTFGGSHGVAGHVHGENQGGSGRLMTSASSLA